MATGTTDFHEPDEPAFAVLFGHRGVAQNHDWQSFHTSRRLGGGAVLYEPPIHLRPRELGRRAHSGAGLAASGRIAAAMRVHLRDIVRLPAPIAWLAGLGVAANPRMRALAPHQLDDDAAVNDLGVRLDAYGHINVATVLLGGDRSPTHLAERLDALSRTIPGAVKVGLRGQGHVANVRAPDAVAKVIEDL